MRQLVTVVDERARKRSSRTSTWVAVVDDRGNRYSARADWLSRAGVLEELSVSIVDQPDKFKVSDDEYELAKNWSDVGNDQS